MKKFKNFVIIALIMCCLPISTIAENTSPVFFDVTIENGKADMISADCPDKLCVNQHAISSNGETIVCLPNKVVVEVEDGEEAQFDTQTK